MASKTKSDGETSGENADTTSTGMLLVMFAAEEEHTPISGGYRFVTLVPTTGSPIFIPSRSFSIRGGARLCSECRALAVIFSPISS